MEFVFVMGLPAAGKSTKAAETFGRTHRFIDPDMIKESHPMYDPENACDIHEWSMEETERQFNDALLFPNQNFVLDGTGTNAESMVRKMNMARDAGFSVTLFYVKCSLRTSLRRAAQRERKVPRSVIVEKSRAINTAFGLIAPFADKITIVDNDKDTF